MSTETAPLVGDGAGQSSSSNGLCCKVCCGCLCCTPFLLIVVVYIGLQKYITGMATAQFVDLDEANAQEYCQTNLTMQDLTYNIWWPGYGYVDSLENFSKEAGKPCYADSFVKEMAAFNAKMPAKLVHYKSRKAEGFETVKLGGWWLPGDKSKLKNGTEAPRIVLQHGFRDNSNTFRTQSLAYLLRSMGFDVLMNNLRDHCYSNNSTAHVYNWGYSYPYDTLGAWDYAVNDPDGKLGGSMDPKKVGLMGYSKGGFLTGIAFGLEKDIPAAWIDSAPLTPKKVFAYGLQNTLGGMGIGFIAPMLSDSVWANVENYAEGKGVNLNEHLPEKILPEAPDLSRPLYIVHNKKDSTVPISEGEGLLALLKKYPKKFTVKGTWFPDEKCETSDHTMDHIIDQLLHTDEYKSKLCEFWSSAFGTEKSAC